MKRYVKRQPYEPNDLDKILTAESVDVNSETYDIESDSLDTYYSFTSLEEYRKFLKQVGAD